MKWHVTLLLLPALLAPRAFLAQLRLPVVSLAQFRGGKKPNYGAAAWEQTAHCSVGLGWDQRCTTVCKQAKPRVAQLEGQQESSHLGHETEEAT